MKITLKLARVGMNMQEATIAEWFKQPGEAFADVRALKKVLREERRFDFYRCLTEKLLTYALGRGTESYDVETVDRIVARLEANGGKFSELLYGVIESAPFQRRRNTTDRQTSSLKPPVQP